MQRGFGANVRVCLFVQSINCFEVEAKVVYELFGASSGMYFRSSILNLIFRRTLFSVNHLRGRS